MAHTVCCLKYNDWRPPIPRPFLLLCTSSRLASVIHAMESLDQILQVRSWTICIQNMVHGVSKYRISFASDKIQSAEHLLSRHKRCWSVFWNVFILFRYFSFHWKTNPKLPHRTTPKLIITYFHTYILLKPTFKPHHFQLQSIVWIPFGRKNRTCDDWDVSSKH